MNILFVVASILFFIWTVRNLLYWTALWQEKEYRLDRLLVHVRETVKGRKLFTSPILYVKWLLIFGYIVIVFNESFITIYHLIITALYAVEAGSVFYELFNHRLKRPVPTIKAIFILIISSIIITVLYLLPLTDVYLWFLILDRLTLCIVALYVFFFAFPTEVYTDITIEKARKKLESFKNLKIIGVSGSYGKSSTKEFIAQLLEEKYHVVKTSGSNNTPIGIAKTILNKISKDTEIFVVEMGAYKKGEVAELCEIVQPQISVTTSISDQHLSLYGSLQNAIDTELELIKSLPKNGVALFNGNNMYTQELHQKCKKKKILYKIVDRSDEKADISASHIIVGQDAITFDVVIEGKKIHMKAFVLGAHMVENILPAIFLAHHFKIPFYDIKKKLITLTPPPKTMKKREILNDVVVIDDTFNASPESVFAAMQYMKIYKKKKIFVLTPLIELGKNAKERHYTIGKVAAKFCDYLFLTNNNFYDDILRGIADSGGDCIVEVEKVEDIAKDITAIVNAGDVVVLEGKESGFVKL